ncbi:hypothetical protein ACQ4LE_004918 [Meloidogyne hapla]
MSAFAAIKNHSSSSSRSRRPNNPAHNERPQSSFVFGSSTPREVSYINKAKVSPQDRLLIDTEPKRKPLPPVGDKDIIYYMRQARSIGPRDLDRKKATQTYAFGSSTPRSLSHLSKLAKEQRVYDAKFERIINKESQGMRSATNPNLVGNKPKAQHQDDDDAASEPDIVQDRRAEFLMTRSAFDMKNNNKDEENGKRKISSNKNDEKKKLENEKALENSLRNNLKLAAERTTPSPESG